MSDAAGTRSLAAFVPITAVLGAMVTAQVGSSFAKLLFPLVGAPGTTTLRVGFSALILLAIFRPWRRSLDKRAAGAITLYGLALGSMNMLFYLALARIPLGVAVAIEFIGPLTVALVGSRRPLDFVWIGLAVLGLALLLPVEGGSALDPIGIALALGAGVCWGLYIVFGHRVSRGGEGTQAVALGMSMAALVAAPFGIADAGWSLAAPSVLLAGLGVAILSSALPYTLEMIALRSMRREVFGVTMSLEPAIAALAALIVLREALSDWQWLAIACVIAASAGAAVSARRDAPGQTEAVPRSGG